MSSVFHTQNEVMKAMEHMLREQKDKRNDTTGRPRRMNSDLLHRAATLNGNSDYSLEAINDHRMYQSRMLTVVDRNIREVDRLDLFAERASRAIQQLLDLKNKQANLKLTQGTDKQGKTVLYFTVATIIFLPLSFMSSFLTIEVKQFPRGDDGKLSIDFVLQVIFAVSVILIVPSVLVAFNLDHESRAKRRASVRAFWRRYIVRPVDHGSNPTARSNQGAAVQATPNDDNGSAPEQKPGQEAAVKEEAIPNNEGSTVKARRKWIQGPKTWWIDRQARPKQPDAESGEGVGGKDPV
ncbi:uncharacterized protein B0H64DRAFT_248055 [Chaetomium fimeti]|uniref:Ankyrin repeat protein n=1 Tax=Chaetomium fimeti TaxID=1854472 RepID=A0AAE0H810_9PEZI|nr:hypothetical protein B0H64DRAFT_248055 [Chaetomium fimeti]